MTKTKQRNSKPTLKQRRAFEKTIENNGNVSKSMVQVGYSENFAKNPQTLTESKGWKQLCEEKGLTDTFLVDALVSDIKGKPKNRKPELELGFKVLGRLSNVPEGLPTEQHVHFHNDKIVKIIGTAEEQAELALRDDT